MAGGLMVAGLLALSACTGVGRASMPEPVEISFSWWGNDDSAATMQRVIEEFRRTHPYIGVKADYVPVTRYFDELNTRIGAGTAPDVITLGGSFTAEYARRGALRDLDSVHDILRTDRLDTLALANGAVDRRQYGVPSGLSAFALVADLTIFDNAKVPLPDDSTWSWKDFERISKEIVRKSPPVTFGVTDFTSTNMLDLFSRQRGESLFTRDNRVGASEGTLSDLWTMARGLNDAGVTPSAAIITDLTNGSLSDRSLMARGRAAMQFDWSNSVESLRRHSGHRLKLLRVPGESTSHSRGMWVQAAQVYSINAASQHPKEAAQFVDFLVNSGKAGKIISIDRGIPANRDVRAEVLPGLDAERRAEAAFVDRVVRGMDPEVPIIFGPKGTTSTEEILRRINDDVLSGRKRPEAAAAEFLRLVKLDLRQ
jgi:multiple sugar transport system substrate-binding protein